MYKLAGKRYEKTVNSVSKFIVQNREQSAVKVPLTSCSPDYKSVDNADNTIF